MTENFSGRSAFESGGSWQPTSRRLLVVRRWQVAAAAFPLLLAGLLVGGFVGSWIIGAVAAAGVVAVAVLFAMVLTRRARSWAYAERDDDLLVRRGLLIRRLSVVPYGRMQFVDVVAGPVERIFGLASVHLHTAAAASDARIPGLPVAEAARLRDSLAALGEARAAGL